MKYINTSSQAKCQVPDLFLESETTSVGSGLEVTDEPKHLFMFADIATIKKEINEQRQVSISRCPLVKEVSVSKPRQTSRLISKVQRKTKASKHLHAKVKIAKKHVEVVPVQEAPSSVNSRGGRSCLSQKLFCIDFQIDNLEESHSSLSEDRQCHDII